MSNNGSLQFPYDPGGSLTLVESNLFSVTSTLSFYKVFDLPTSEDSYLQKAPPRLHVNGYMVRTEQRLHMKEATYGSQLVAMDDRNIAFLRLLFVGSTYTLEDNKFPFDPGGCFWMKSLKSGL
ncbi:hypothetical protein K7X08_032635 [Anisodus acutangulus]|uniref:Uncharacterized protein n=1 Tax=Anisodus acutangulus TaxID=402998 RepID=A0A9Q1LX08_9SOLA|nr:hypothetical protein K7X08_032635 [Anisodus acutangulus]